ncbi:MAG: non-ribosomal peptide synthetase, partial [Oxalobacteraceae bacterium]
ATQGYVGAHHPFALSPDLTAGLRDLSRRHGTTMFMTLLAGWALLLARMAGQQDVVIGSPVANRQRTELEGLIGFFVNTLALRVQPRADLTVAALLAQVKACTLGSYEHQDLPFDQVVEALQPVRSTSYGPLFQAMINVHNTPGDSTLAAAGLVFSPVETLENTVQCDLVLSVSVGADTIGGTLNYACDLFDEDTVARMATHLRCVFEAMVADDQQALGRVALLDADQRGQVVGRFNDTATAAPDARSVHQVFERHAALNPHGLSLDGDGVQLTYAQLNRRANQLAHHLLALGVQPDDRVAICLERGIDMVVGMLAVLKAGGCYVPLDPGCPPERLAYMLSDCMPVALVTRAALAADMVETAVPLVLVDAHAGTLEQACADNPDTAAALSPANLAHVIYTSGSTGLPKGVMIEHGNVLNLILNNGYAPLGYGDRVSHGASPAFDAATLEIWSALLHGAGLVIVKAATMLDPALLREKLVDSGVTVLFLTSALLNQHAAILPELLPRLRRVLFGGEKVELGGVLAAHAASG